MKNSPKARRLINNELQTRGFNQKVKKVLKDHTPSEERDDLHIDFYCECSKADCTARIAMTFAEYEKLHKDDAQFVIAEGHETPSVEEIQKVDNDLMVVKKFAV